MNISELPQKIKELALKRQTNSTEDKLEYAFTWYTTPKGEGYHFWNQIDDGNFEPFYKLYPEKEFPRMMMVWDKEETQASQGLVLGFENGLYQIAYVRRDFLNGDDYEVYQHKNAKEIPSKTKVTFEVTEEQEAEIKKLLNK
jgi:hypothetical protein